MKHVLKLCVALSVAAASAVGAEMPDGKKINLQGALPASIETVGVVMPASICKKPAFNVYVAALEEAGCKVKLAPRLDFERVAPAEDRAKDFEEMWMDPEVDLVLCARGGKGSEQILPFLDWDRLRTRKQRVLGFSNITRLLNAMAKEGAGEPFSGPTMSQFRYCDRATLSWLNKAIARAKMPELKLRPLRAGACEGLACGGHVAILRDAVKAGQALSAKGRIVFLECGNRTPEEVENALSELADCGYFKDAAGVVFGDITVNMPVSKAEKASKVEEIKKAFAEKASCPVFDGYPYGHVPRSFTIDFNRRHLIASDGVMTLE